MVCADDRCLLLAYGNVKFFVLFFWVLFSVLFSVLLFLA